MATLVPINRSSLIFFILCRCFCLVMFCFFSQQLSSSGEGFPHVLSLVSHPIFALPVPSKYQVLWSDSAKISSAQLEHLQDLPILKSLRAKLWCSVTLSACKSGKTSSCSQDTTELWNHTCYALAIIYGGLGRKNPESYGSYHDGCNAPAFKISGTILVTVGTELAQTIRAIPPQYPQQDITGLKTQHRAEDFSRFPPFLMGVVMGRAWEHKSVQHWLLQHNHGFLSHSVFHSHLFWVVAAEIQLPLSTQPLSCASETQRSTRFATLAWDRL